MIKRYIFDLLLMVCAQNCFAFSCKNYTPSTLATLSSSNISIARNLPIGSEIARATAGNISVFSCVNSAPLITYQYLGIKGFGKYLMNLDTKRIYSTNIEGIGYAVYGETEPCSGYGAYVTGDNNVDGNPNNAWLCSVNGMFSTQPTVASGQIIFYKTAAVTGSGTVSVGDAASFILQNNNSLWVLPESFITVPSFDVSSRGCDVNQSPINVNMGSIPKNRFTGLGTSPSDSNTKQFNIGLTCNANTKVNIKMEGNIQSADQGLLALTSSANSAKGVAIQLLFNGSPLVLGKPFYIGTSNIDGLYDVNLSARYFQIGDITSGTANSTATFTVTYE